MVLLFFYWLCRMILRLYNFFVIGIVFFLWVFLVMLMYNFMYFFVRFSWKYFWNVNVRLFKSFDCCFIYLVLECDL